MVRVNWSSEDLALLAASAGRTYPGYSSVPITVQYSTVAPPCRPCWPYLLHSRSTDNWTWSRTLGFDLVSSEQFVYTELFRTQFGL